MFINHEDYRVVVGEAAFKTISQDSAENLAVAEAEAIEEISGYLRPVYDTDAVFSAKGKDRNRLVVMYTVDIMLYHLVASQPRMMGLEIRKERYERAIEWLEDVQSGKISPGLPLAAEDDVPESNGTVFHSEPRLRHNW